MPELLDPQQTEYVPVPAQERPVARRPQGGGVDRLRPKPPPDPFRPRPGPPLLLLPHDPAAGQAPQQPVQQRRGRPVRLSNDTVGLARAAADRPGDDAPWGILADALDEAGKPHAARLARMVAATPVDDRTMAFRLGELPTGAFSHDGTVGHAGGLWFGLRPSPAGTWGVWVYRNPSGTINGNLQTVGQLTADREHGAGLLEDIDQTWGANAHGLSFGERRRQLREQYGHAPERFAAAQAGPQGELFRGTMYTAGQFVPAPMPAPPAAAPRPRPRTRLRGALRKSALRLARPRLDTAIVRGMYGADRADVAPWLRLADHFEDQDMPHLAASLRAERHTGDSTWNPGDSWGRPDVIEASGFPAWGDRTPYDEGARAFHDLMYWPEHGVATSRLKVMPHGRGISDPENPEWITLIRGHDRIRDLAAEMEQNQVEDGNRDWADEYARVRDEAARRAGGSA